MHRVNKIGGGGQQQQQQQHQRSRSSGRNTTSTATRPQHLQESVQQQQHQQQPQAPPSASGSRGGPTATASRGRSRRSRAATRRGLGTSTNRPSEISRVEEEDVLSSPTANDNNNMNSSIDDTQQMMDSHNRNNSAPPKSSSISPKLALNLHVADSVDSDDNGTCFNSIGTTTPRQPSPRRVIKHQKHQPQQQQQQQQLYQPNLHDDNYHHTPPDNATTPNNNRLHIHPTPSKNKHLLRSRAHRAANHGQYRNNNANLINPTTFENTATLTPLQENGTPSPRTNNGNSSGGSRNNNAMEDGKDKRTIWDRPEEMISTNNNTNRGANNSNNGTANNNNTARDNSSAYSEFDHDDKGSHRGGNNGGGSVSAWNSQNYNSSAPQQVRRVRRSPYNPSGGGSVESNSRYEEDHVPTKNAMLENGGVVGGEPFRGNRSNNNGVGNVESVASNNVEMNEVDAFLNKPNMKAALGVGAAATLGAVILGPVGLLVGAASVGIGMGVMQIPEEQRTNVRKHAAISLEKARDIACDLSDTMSVNCAKYGNGSVSIGGEPVGLRLRDEIMDTLCSKDGGDSGGDGDDHFRERHSNRYHNRGGGGMGMMGEDLIGGGNGTDHHLSGMEIRSEGSSPIANAVNGVERGMNRLVGDVFGQDNTNEHPSPVSQSMNIITGGVGGNNEKGGRSGGGVGGGDHHGGTGLGEGKEDGAGRRVACGRKGRVVPLSQIHSLRPSLQPRAWLDVMASAHTTRDDKNEAMQEILILAKDKEISRWFLEEGILDSLMFILSNYFRNYSSFLRNETSEMVEKQEEPFSSFKQGGNAFFHAKLAANSCVALGKAHCAVVHTEGDLLLMSAYSRGSVPVERQLAQMLFEVPHHMKVMNPAHVATGQGGNNVPGEVQQQFDVEFTLTELSMQQAEDLASSIKALDDGKIDV